MHPPGPYHNGMGMAADSGWDAGGWRGDFHNQDRTGHQGYDDGGWNMGRREEYREVGRPGREDAGWDIGGHEYREVRRVGRDEGSRQLLHTHL